MGIGALISMLIGTATSAVQSIWGGSQLKKAKKLEQQNPRPVAGTSQTIKDLLGYSYGRTLDQDIPGGELYRNEIKGATAAGINAASRLGSGAEAYGMLGQLVGREQGAMTDLAKLAAEKADSARSNYMNVLAGPAYQEERRVDYWNREMPYLQAAQTAQALRQSGAQNIMAGIKNIGGVMSEGFAPDLSSSLLGEKGKTLGTSISSDQLEKIIKAITG